MTEKPEDAHYRFIYDVVVLDGKKYAVYRLGSEGKKMLLEAMCRTQYHETRWNFEQEIKELKSMLNVLTDIIGGPSAMVEYFKRHILVQIGNKSCRTGDLTVKPYTIFKYVALQQLLKEDKVIHTRNGWWKLGKI